MRNIQFNEGLCLQPRRDDVGAFRVMSEIGMEFTAPEDISVGMGSMLRPGCTPYE